MNAFEAVFQALKEQRKCKPHIACPLFYVGAGAKECCCNLDATEVIRALSAAGMLRE